MKAKLILSGLIVAAILGSGCGNSQTLRERLRERRVERQAEQPALNAPPLQRLQFDGLERSFYLLAPNGNGSARRPLVVFLHGGSRTADDAFARSSWPQFAQEENFLFLAPNAVDKNWNDGRKVYFRDSDPSGVDDVGFVAFLIDKMVKEQGADPDRVYVTGASNGGNLTWRLACLRGDKIAAIGPLISTMPADAEQLCAEAPPMPVMAFFGLEDPLMPYDGASVQLRNGGQSEPRLSAPNSTAFWARRNGCSDAVQAEDLPDLDRSDGTTVRRITYLDCPKGREVVRYDVIGGGHNAPGAPPPPRLLERLLGKSNADVKSAQLQRDFFLHHSR